MISARSDYNSCIRKSKYSYDHLQTTKLVQARFRNARLDWNMLKQSAGM